MLAVVDEAIGQITAALDEKGIRDNTIIIFSSDNSGAHAGNGTMNTPLRAGKGSIYEGGVRVPERNKREFKKFTAELRASGRFGSTMS